jgi:hypothetical protein
MWNLQVTSKQFTGIAKAPVSVAQQGHKARVSSVITLWHHTLD